MKECPSCHSTIQSPLLMCPNCGYSFDSEPEKSEGREVKKTMMGIPSIDLHSLNKESEQDSEEAARRTMFGFPVNEVVSEVFDEGTDAYEESATQIVDADQFMFDEAQNAPSSEGPRFVEKPSVRSTMAGGMPSLAELYAAQESGEDVSDAEEEDAGGKTQVAAASLFQFDGAADEVTPPESTDSPKLHSRPKKHETLMGMSLDDLAPEGAKNTLFSIPTHDDMGDGLSEFSEDESDVEEDIPTQAISGAVFAQEPVQEATREQNRQRLLDKLRAHNKEGDEERPARSTMFGIPAVSPADSSSGEERAPSHTPHTGVLKVAKKSGSPGEPSEASIEASTSGVLGSSSYMLNKDSTASEAPAQADSKKPLPSLNLSKSLRDKLSAATAKSAPKPAVKTPVAQTSEPEIPALTTVAPSNQYFNVEDKTQVVSDDLLEQALENSQNLAMGSPEPSGLEQKSAPTTQHESPQLDDDMTREQNISDLKLQLRQSSEQPATSRKHFSEDATRQHDLASIREQLGDDLFALTPSEASEVSEVSEHDATAIAPSLEEAPRSNTGPLFATGRPDVNPVEMLESSPEIAPSEELPELDLLPVEPLPELDMAPVASPPIIPTQPVPPAQPVQPAPPVRPVIPVQEPAPAPEVADMPMIDAVPLPVEPAYKTVTTTSSPTPPHGTQVPVAAQGMQEDGAGVGRTFQVIFGLLGAVCFVCATIFPVLGIASPGDAVLSGAVYAPVGLGVLTLIGALFPANKVRVALLILATLLGLAMFAVGLLLAMPIILSILSLVGALFALTGILFPIFARSM